MLQSSLSEYVVTMEQIHSEAFTKANIEYDAHRERRARRYNEDFKLKQGDTVYNIVQQLGCFDIGYDHD